MLRRVFSFIFALLICFSMSGFWVEAATVTSVYDRPSSLKTSTGSNHLVVFTTPGGVAEGETLTLTFPSGFTTSSVVEDDVDVADDGVDLSTAADCSGSEAVSVVMASSVLTLTWCSGDGGAVAAASEVTIEVGANATASGSGSNQVTNPSSIGTYYLALAGTFGDSGTVPVPVVSET